MLRGYITLDNCTNRELNILKEELGICYSCKNCSANFYATYCTCNCDINKIIKKSRCNKYIENKSKGEQSYAS